jgi:hypothetical protein
LVTINEFFFVNIDIEEDEINEKQDNVEKKQIFPA